MKKYVFLLLLFACIFSVTVPAFANSAEPPTLIIFGTGIPEDAVLTLVTTDGEEHELRQIRREDRAWESVYRLWFPWEIEGIEESALRVTVGQERFTCALPVSEGRSYRTVLTLDYAAQTLTLGQNPWRQPLLTALRIVLTLLTEGLVFYLFGFREKRSWIAFLIINLLTQGWLNIEVNNYYIGSYWTLSFAAIEFVIFLAEFAAVPLAVKEHGYWRKVAFALTANAVSLVLGIYIIGNLPL